MAALRTWVVLVLCFSCALWSISAEQLPIKTYTAADGLPRDRVYKTVVDPHGFLWFCTNDGLSRFDGDEFTNYGIQHGLPHRIVNPEGSVKTMGNNMIHGNQSQIFGFQNLTPMTVY